MSFVNKIYEGLKNVPELIIYNSLKIMDIYTLARIFHYFRPEKDEMPRNFPLYATNIIYYSGENHSRYTQSLLIQIGFKEIFAQQNRYDKACVIAPSFRSLEQMMIL